MSECAFKYHPEPLKTGVFKNDKAVLCGCCGLVTDVYYDGWFYSSRPGNITGDNFCPRCIMSGKAADRFDGVFQESVNTDEVSDLEKLDELIHRTPGSLIYQGYWVAHCGDFCSYVGFLEWGEFEERGLLGEIRETYREDITALEFEDFVHDFEHNGVHLYRCLRCGKHIAMIEYD